MKCSDAQYNYIIHDSVIKFVNTKGVPISTWCKINKVNLFWKYSHKFQRNNECLQWTGEDVIEKSCVVLILEKFMSAYRIFQSPLGFALPTTSFTYSYTSRWIYIRAGGGGGRSNTHLPPFHNQILLIFVEIYSQKLFKIFSAISWSSFRIPPLSQFAVSEHHQLPDIPSRDYV